jgi:hypothetical protein
MFHIITSNIPSMHVWTTVCIYINKIITGLLLTCLAWKLMTASDPSEMVGYLWSLWLQWTRPLFWPLSIVMSFSNRTFQILSSDRDRNFLTNLGTGLPCLTLFEGNIHILKTCVQKTKGSVQNFLKLYLNYKQNPHETTGRLCPQCNIQICCSVL